jgi:CubicO group peptidase (beta-lactamase class C family)
MQARAVAAVLAAALVAPAACTGGGGRERQPTSLSSGARQEIGVAVDTFFHDPTGYSDDVRSLLVYVNGVPVVDRYRHVSAEQPQTVASVTTAVVSVLVGIAIDRGVVAGVSSTLADLLPGYRSVMSRPVAAVTLRQILTMTAGFRDDTPQWRAAQRSAGGDWVAAVLRSRRAGAGRFHYTDAGTHLLSAILQQATGRPLLAFAQQSLFAPLGISGVAWAQDPQGRNLAFDGLRIRAADLARIGELMVAGGRWHGSQVVSSGWTRASTTPRVTYQQLVEPSGQFGYGWWVLNANGHAGFTAADVSGQVLEGVPDERLVVVLTSRVRGASRVGFSAPLSWVGQLVVPALEKG